MCKLENIIINKLNTIDVALKLMNYHVNTGKEMDGNGARKARLQYHKEILTIVLQEYKNANAKR